MNNDIYWICAVEQDLRVILNYFNGVRQIKRSQKGSLAGTAVNKKRSTEYESRPSSARPTGHTLMNELR